MRLLEDARRQQHEQETAIRQRTKLQDHRDAKRRQWQRQKDKLQELLRLAGTSNERALPEIGGKVRRKLELLEQREKIDTELRAVRGNEDQSDFEEAVARVDATELESQQEVLQADIERVDEEFRESLQQQGVARKRLDELDQASRAAEVAQQIESDRSELAECVDRWVPLVLARRFMQRAMDRFQREHQPRLLVEVGRLLNRMTLGRYTEISRKLDEHGALLVHEGNGHTKEPHQLSTGTREQLYLAIRLAYVLHYCREAEPLPIIMDDVLVNFDDERAAQTLSALIEMSEQHQLILLTCHRNTIQLVQDQLPHLEPLCLDG